jgi:hypothetical protein
MADNVKITGTVDHFRAEETPAHNAQSDVALTVELPLRDLFAAFALSAVISLDLEDGPIAFSNGRDNTLTQQRTQ